MKYICIAILLLFSACGGTHKIPGYIEFGHTGITDHIDNPLIISTHELNIRLTDMDSVNLRMIYGDEKIPSLIIKRYIRSAYEMVITDDKTLLEMKKFIIEHNQYYENQSNSNNGAFPSYAIHFNQPSYTKTKYSVYYKFKEKFLKDLITDLNEKGCDKKVIHELSLGDFYL